MRPDSRAARALVMWVLRHLRARYALHLGLILTLAAVALLPPQLFRFFVYSLHASAAGGSLVTQLLAYSAGIALALSGLTLLSAISREKIQLRIEALLRTSVTRQMLTVPLESFDGLSRGEFLTRLGGDLTKVESFIASSIPMQLRHLATLLLAAGLFVTQCGPLALIPLGLVMAVAVLGFLAQRRLIPLLDELRTLHAGVFQEMLQGFESVRTLRTHGAGRRHLDRFRWRLAQMGARSVRVVAYAGSFDAASTLGYQMMMGGCLAFAAWRVSTGQMSFDTALTFPFYLGFFYSAAESLAGALGEWNRFIVDSRRLWELMPTLADDGDLGENEMPLVPAALQLRARDLRIGYAGRALSEPLQFTLQTGKTLVLVGPSGAGKSTLLEVFSGLRAPLSGAIACLDARGDTISAASNGLCAVVEQRACLWSGTIRSNLTFGDTDLAADADLWQALRDVGLEKVVTRAGGLDAWVDDRGLNFSEGQRYRLALARALLLPRPFLLLDEPFAALDAESIETVTRAINHGKRHRGYLIVTHQIPPSLSIDGYLQLGSAPAAIAL